MNKKFEFLKKEENLKISQINFSELINVKTEKNEKKNNILISNFAKENIFKIFDEENRYKVFKEYTND